MQLWLLCKSLLRLFERHFAGRTVIKDEGRLQIAQLDRLVRNFILLLDHVEGPSVVFRTHPEPQPLSVSTLFFGEVPGAIKWDKLANLPNLFARLLLRVWLKSLHPDAVKRFELAARKSFFFCATGLHHLHRSLIWEPVFDR